MVDVYAGEMQDIGGIWSNFLHELHQVVELDAMDRLMVDD
jgi:hypothetical protein